MLTQVRTRGRLLPLDIPVLGARLRSATTTIIAIAAVAIAVILAAWINWQAEHTAALAARSIEVRERAERFLGQVRDAETGQRGYLLTGMASYLAPYTAGRAAALPELDAIEALVTDDARQKERVEQVRHETFRRFRELDETIALMREGRGAEAIIRVREGEGIAIMGSLRGSVQQIQLAENLKSIALGRNEGRRRMAASVIIVVALAGLAFAAWLQIRARQRRSATLAMSNAQLEELIDERTQELEKERLRIEALLRDVNHRVGNNLAMVSALLNVQTRKAREPSVRSALAQAQSRIQAIAAGQRRLRLDLETDEIEARPYMEDLLAEIGKAVEGRPIAIELDIGAIRLPGRDAISFVVIVNELVTNAIKHAFPDGAPGTVAIRLQETTRDGNPALSLVIEDDGVGMPAESGTKGLGQTVISNLMRSMGATMTSEALKPGAERPGSRITLVFPRKD